MTDLTASAIEGVRVQGMARLAALWDEGDRAHLEHDAAGVIAARERRKAVRLLVASECSGEPVRSAPELRGRLHARDLERMFGGHL